MASIPMAYHGTSRPFDKFELGSDVSNPIYGGSSPDHGLGIFFTDNLTMAKWFAGLSEYDPEQAEGYVPTGKEGFIIAAKLNISKPWVLQDHAVELDEDPGQTYFNIVSQAGGGEKFKSLLMKQGYDGVVVKGMTTNYYGDGTYNMYVVFDSGQAEVIRMIGNQAQKDHMEFLETDVDSEDLKKNDPKKMGLDEEEA